MEGLLKSQSLEAHEVGEDEGCGARDTRHAVHEDVGLLSGLADEVGCGFKVDAEIVVGMVLAGNIEGEGDVLFGVLDVNILAGSED